MKKIAMLTLLGFMLCLPSAFAESAVPSLINYQGKLTDANGDPLVSGNYTIEFRIWDAATGGSLIWSREYSGITVVDGNFNIILGSGGSGISGDSPAVNDLLYAFVDSSRYIGVTITNTPEGPVTSPTQIEPRQQILSTPYAMHSEYALHGDPVGSIQA